MKRFSFVVTCTLLFCYATNAQTFAKGDGNILKRSYEETCHACHKTDSNTTNDPNSIKTHNSLTTGSTKWTPNGWGISGGKYGPIVCTTCHTVHDTSNVYLIRNKIYTPDSSNWTSTNTSVADVIFKKKVSSSSPNPGVADGVMGSDAVDSANVCEVCHSLTSHFRWDGTGSDQTHSNVGGASGLDCTTCHSHKNGFAHGIGGGGCLYCHGHEDDWPPYASGYTWHGTKKAHATHTENDSNDLKGPHLQCSDCHNTSKFPTFKDGATTLTATTVCDPCHSPGGTYDGVNDPVIGAKNNWSNVGSLDSNVYASDGSLKPGKEKWCAGCHDEKPSEIQGVRAPDVIGDESASYTYGTGYGYYKTGHGLAAGEAYPYKGGLIPPSLINGAARPVNCDSCHDSTTSHIDGIARTFDDGNSDSLDPSNYRIGYRLKLVNGQEPMRVPLPNSASNSSDNFRLCASCHDPAPFVTAGSIAEGHVSGNMNTNFVTSADNSGNIANPFVNRHEYHLRSIGFGVRYSSDWDMAAYNSRITCVTCHNVHGSTRLAMVRDGKLIGRELGLKIWYDNPIVKYDATHDAEPVPANIPLAASTGTVWSAGSCSNLCTTCHGNNNLASKTRTPFQNVALPPTLAWTGRLGYESDGVNPDSGASGSSFTFMVKYTDANNDEPAVHQVWVDMNDNGVFDSGEGFVMSALNPSDGSYDGKVYAVSLPLFKAGDNTFKYCFDFQSNGQQATGDPDCTHDHYVSITNNAPRLSWTGETYYSNAGVYPNPGGNGANYTFRIKYTDIDDDAPSLTSGVQVWVDLNGNGIYENGEKFDMSAVDSGDNDYADGKLYTKSMNINYAGGGVVHYTFRAKDSGNASAIQDAGPLADNTLTIFSSSNTPPLLEWTTGNCLTEGVRPRTGAINAGFEFRVKYTDIDGQCPSYIRATVNGTTCDLTSNDGASCSTGRVYYGSITLTAAGDLKYHFSASDGTSTAVGDPTSDKMVTVVNTPYKVKPGGVAPWYSSIETAINDANSSAIILVYPSVDSDFSEGVYAGPIDLKNHTNLTVQSVCGPELTIIDGNAGANGVVKVPVGASSNNTVDGFSIRNSTADGVFLQSGTGQPISNITIKNCWIYSNAGRGIYMWWQCNPIYIENCLIHDNSGSGIYVGSNGNALHVSDSAIYSNTTSGNGGGVVLWDDTGHTFANTTITGNTSGDRGGAIYFHLASARFDNCTINNNTSTNGGGGFYFNSGSATINDTFMQGNQAGGNGGALYFNSYGHADLTNVIMTGNKAGGDGGASYEMGHSYVNYLFCTISGNYAGGVGGGILHSSDTMTNVRNSIVFNNDSAGGYPQKQIYAQSNHSNAITAYNTLISQKPATGSSPYLSYTDGGGNINDGTPPTFVNGLNPSSAPTSDGNYRLQSSSPAIDAANSAWTSDHDIFGGHRPQGSGYDMGADEYSSGGSDTTPPSSLITDPAGSTVFNLASSDPYTLTGTASDNVAVSGVEVSADNGFTWHTADCAGCPGADVTWTYSWALPSDGIYEIRSRATDSSGNVGMPGNVVTVTVDMTPPSVSSTIPAILATGMGIDGTVTINWSENVDCSTVSSSTVTISPSVGWARTSCSGSQAVFLPSGQSGSTWYAVNVSTSVKDVAGNAMGAAYSFTYETVPSPVVKPAAPTIQPATVLSTTSIWWNFTDNANNETGFRLHNELDTLMMEAAQADLSYIDETGLIANTQYTRHVHAYNAGGDSDPSGSASKWTLPAAPNVTADKTTGTWHNTANVVFTNAAGFAGGGVDHYDYAWDQNSSYTFGGSEPHWNSGTLTRASTGDGNWYLHVKSFNGGGDSNGTQNYGPFYYDGSAPSASSLSPGNGATQVAVNSNLTFTLSDAYSGVDWSSFQIQLSGDKGYSKTYTDSDTGIVSATGNQASYNVTVNPDADFSQAERISVTLTVNDFAGNALMVSSASWQFTTFSVTNNPPVLSWSAGACLDKGVRPSTGAVGANFQFRVKYADSVDGDCPDANGVKVTVNGTTYTLDAEAGGDCTTGKIYSKMIQINTSGNLYYSFSATDSKGTAATGDPTLNNTNTVTVVNTTYKVKPSTDSGPGWGGSGWYNDNIGSAIVSGATVLVYPKSDFTSYTYGAFTVSGKPNVTVIGVCGAGLTGVSAGGSGTGIYTSSTTTEINGFTVSGSGTGIQIYGSTGNIKNCKITGNTASGVKVTNGATGNIYDSDIYNNSVSGDGGGIWSRNGSANTVNVYRSYVRGNSATGYGGGLYVYYGTINLYNVIVSGNYSASSGGGASVWNTGTLNVYNGTISGNKAAGDGGGIHHVNTTDPKSVLINSILYNNYAGSGLGHDWRIVNNGDCGASSITYSYLYSSGAPYLKTPGCSIPMSNNITNTASPFVNGLDPSLVPSTGTAGGDYRLCGGNGAPDPACTAVAPCIDKASATSAPTDDIEGKARPYDTPGVGNDSPSADTFDMGAYEYKP